MSLLAGHKAHVFWMISEKAVRALSGFFVAAAVARYLGPANYGELAVALGTIAVFSAGVSMGAEHINTAELARSSKQDSDRLFFSALVLRLVWSVVLVSCLFLFVTWLGDESRDLYASLWFLVPLAAVSVVGNKVQANGDFEHFAKLTIAALVVSASVRLAGIFLQKDVGYFAIAAVVESALIYSVLFCWVLSRKDVCIEGFRFDRKLAKDYMALVAPTALSAVLIALYLRLELFMVNHLLGPQDAGLWAAVLMMITPWGMVISAVLPIANRHLARTQVTDVNLKIRRLLRYMTAFAVVAMLINSVVATFLLPVVFGPRYAHMRELVWIASLALLPLFVGTVQEIWIAQQRNTSVVLKKALLGLPLSAALLYVFIGWLGLAGAAVAMVLSYFTTAIAMNLLFDREFMRLQWNSFGKRTCQIK